MCIRDRYHNASGDMGQPDGAAGLIDVLSASCLLYTSSRCFGSLSTPIKQLLYVLALAAFNRFPTCINPVSMNDSSKVIGWVSNCMTSGMHHRTGLSNGMAERHILLAARLLRKCVTIQYLSLCISHLNLPRCPFPGDVYKRQVPYLAAMPDRVSPLTTV